MENLVRVSVEECGFAEREAESAGRKRLSEAKHCLARVTRVRSSVSHESKHLLIPCEFRQPPVDGAPYKSSGTRDSRTW
jgi:hypothetical protein